MNSSEDSPQRKQRNLKRRAKHEIEEEDSRRPNKRLKTEPNKSSLEDSKNNFMRACLKVSFDAYKNFEERFELEYLQDCVNMCIHNNGNFNLKQISQAAEQIFTIDMKNKTWDEALETCLICITPSQYLSPNMLKDIVEIIMNAHEDYNTDCTIDYLMGKCRNTLMLHFNIHPPCLSVKSIRDCYKNFLTSPMDYKEELSLSNRKVYLSDEGIVSYCFTRLAHDLSLESTDGPLLEKQEAPIELNGVKRLHWMKENVEMFEFLERTERIERCMMVLESVLYLLQTDLSLWLSRSLSAGSQKKSQRPLLSYLLWPSNGLCYGTVTRKCAKIIELFAYYIHLQYPEQHIKTMSMWMNIVTQMFYMSDSNSLIDYPNRGPYYAGFVKEFHRIILPLPSKSILRILEQVQPSFMQHLLGLHHIQRILNITHSDIIYIIMWCLQDMCWDSYPAGDQELNIIKKRSEIKPGKFYEYLADICKTFTTSIDDDPRNTYPKLELRKEKNVIQQDYLLNILLITFIAYLKSYNIKVFNQTLECYNENKLNRESTSYMSYSVSENFVKKYRSIVQSLKELLVVLKERESNDKRSKKLLDLINIYFS